MIELYYVCLYVLSRPHSGIVYTVYSRNRIAKRKRIGQITGSYLSVIREIRGQRGKMAYQENQAFLGKWASLARRVSMAHQVLRSVPPSH